MSEHAPSSTVSSDTITLDELAQRLGISLSVAYRLAPRNELPIPSFRVGRRYLFSRKAYERLMDGGVEAVQQSA